MSENENKKNVDSFDVYVEKRKSSRKEGKFYDVLVIKFDTEDQIVTFDLDLIGRMSDLSVRQIQKIEVGKPRKVGTYILG